MYDFKNFVYRFCKLFVKNGPYDHMFDNRRNNYQIIYPLMLKNILRCGKMVMINNRIFSRHFDGTVLCIT